MQKEVSDPVTKKFRKLFLHIGFEKSGSTSIQDFLHHNRAALERDGFFFPASVGAGNHKLLAAACFPEGSQDIAVTSARVGTNPGDHERFRARTLKALTEEARRSKAETAIISSEDFSRLFKKEGVARALDPLREMAEDLWVVVFLRRQDLMACSRYYSLLLGGSSRKVVLPTGARSEERIYDYRRLLRNWIGLLGVDRILAVRYPENPRAEKFNSVQAFCDIVGIDTAWYEPAERKHVSLDAVNQLILQIENEVNPGLTEREIKDFVEILRMQNDPSRFRFIPPRRIAKKFYEHFEADNAALFAELGIEDQGFSDDFTMYSGEDKRREMQEVAIGRLLKLRQGAERGAGKAAR